MRKHNQYLWELVNSGGIPVSRSLLWLLFAFGGVLAPNYAQAGDLKADFEKLQINSRVEVELEFVADSVLRAESIKPAPKEGKDKLRG